MPATVEGHCDPRFGPLRDAFQANFAERGELGAAVCVMVHGRVVADLYGGWADQEHGRRWQPDSPAPPTATTSTPSASWSAR